MAKRIEFIAPVEAMRGNLSGRQDLRYAENDNKAYSSPVGQTNYARNYTPRFVGAKRAADGRKYFSVRTKNAINNTVKAQQAMALLGGTGAIYAAIVNSDTLRNGVELVYRYLIDRGSAQGGISADTTFRKYVSDTIRAALEAKATIISFAGGAGVDTVTLSNPWNAGGTGTAISIPLVLLVKFWARLAVGGIYFYVDGKTGIAKINQQFADIIDTDPYDTALPLLSEEIGGTAYVYITVGGVKHYLLTADGDEVTVNTAIVSGARYTTTTTAPTA